MGCGVAVYACATATQVNLSMIETCNILPATGSAGRRPIGYALFATQILGSLRGDPRPQRGYRIEILPKRTPEARV